MKAKINITFMAVLLLALSTTGCARQKELERINSEQSQTITSLNNEIADLNRKLQDLSKSQDDLAKAKTDLERKLKSELAGGDLSLSMGPRGLTLTVLDKVLFDSGKAEIKDSARGTLDKVADILNRDTRDNMVYVEGHTDDEPIRRSSWKSNWELSTARATEVIHYLSEEASVNPVRLVASGYGEFHPVTGNDSLGGKQKNRRVEIVITPHKHLSQKLQGAAQEQAVGTEGMMK